MSLTERPFISKLLSTAVAPWLMMLPPPGIRRLAAAASADPLASLASCATPGFKPMTCVIVTRNQGQVLKHLRIRHASQVARFGLQLHVCSSHGNRFGHRARFQSYVQYRCLRHDHLHVRRRGCLKPLFRDFERVLPWRKQGGNIQSVVVGLRGSRFTRGHIRNLDLSTHHHCTGGVRDHTADGACSTCLRA